MDAVKLIEAAVAQSHEPYAVDEVLREIDEGRSVPFIGERSILIANLQAHHDVITAHGWLGGGDMAELVTRIRPASERWAKAEGAAYATIDGRRGWVRALRDHGYDEVSVTMRKAL